MTTQERADLTVELERLEVARHNYQPRRYQSASEDLWDLDMRIRELRRKLNGTTNGAERLSLDGARALRA